MTHTEALDLILANTCPSDAPRGDVLTFDLDLHCTVARVQARLLSTMNTIQYEIVSVEILD